MCTKEPGRRSREHKLFPELLTSPPAEAVPSSGDLRTAKHMNTLICWALVRGGAGREPHPWPDNEPRDQKATEKQTARNPTGAKRGPTGSKMQSPTWQSSAWGFSSNPQESQAPCILWQLLPRKPRSLSSWRELCKPAKPPVSVTTSSFRDIETLSHLYPNCKA